MIFYCCQSPALFISPMPSLSAVSALSNRSVFHKDCSAPCRVVSCAPTAPALPPGNPALSSYIPRSDCGLYYCFPLSAPTGIPSLSDFSVCQVKCVSFVTGNLHTLYYTLILDFLNLNIFLFVNKIWQENIRLPDKFYSY